MPLVAHQQWSFSRGEPLSAMPLHVCTVCTMAEFVEFCPKNDIFLLPDHLSSGILK